MSGPWQRMAVVGAGVLVGGLLSLSCLRDNPRHCANAGGDAECIDRHGAQSYCSRCTAERDGCVDARPSSACHVPTESGADGESESESEGTATEPDVDTGTDTAVAVDCDGEGLDPVCPEAAPFCVDGGCVSCSSGGGSALCAEHMPDKSVCQEVAGVCVACLPDETDGCPESAPFCDDTFSCSGCFAHAHCPDSACDMERGTCFDVSRVFWVDNSNPNCPEGGTGSAEDPYCTIEDALDEIKSPASAEFELQSEGVIKIVRTNSPYSERVGLTLGQDRRIALIGEGSPNPQIRHGTYAIEVGRHRVFASRLLLSNNTEGGVRAALGGRVWLDDVTISSNPVGVTVASGARVVMRNVRTFNNHERGIIVGSDDSRLVVRTGVIGNNGDEEVDGGGVLVEDGGRFEALYVTIAHNRGTSAPGVACVGGTATVRNSIVVGPQLDGIDCSEGTFSHSYVDTAIDGEGIVVTRDYDEEWFVSVGSGIFRPTSSNPFGTTARWELGDPLFDLVGDVRPWAPGSPDPPGAIRP